MSENIHDLLTLLYGGTPATATGARQLLDQVESWFASQPDSSAHPPAIEILFQQLDSQLSQSMSKLCPQLGADWTAADACSAPLRKAAKIDSPQLRRLRAYLYNVYAQTPVTASAGPESLVESVLGSFLQNPEVSDRPQLRNETEIWPLLTDITLRKLKKRLQASGLSVESWHEVLDEVSAEQFITAVQNDCSELLQRVGHNEDVIAVARRCLRGDTLEAICGAMRERTREWVLVVVSNLRSQLAIMSAAAGAI